MLASMAFLREYELLDNSSSEWTLIEYFYMDSYDRVPALVLRLSCPVLHLTLDKKRYSVTSTIIVEEVARLFNLIEQPYWKHYVRTNSQAHRFRQDGLFDS